MLDEQDNFVQVSPSSQGILDYAPEELIGRNLASFVHTQDIDATRAEMRVSRRQADAQFRNPVRAQKWSAHHAHLERHLVGRSAGSTS